MRFVLGGRGWSGRRPSARNDSHNLQKVTVLLLDLCKQILCISFCRSVPDENELLCMPFRSRSKHRDDDDVERRQRRGGGKNENE